MEECIEALACHFEKHPIDLGKEYQWPRGRNAISADETFRKRVALAERFAEEPAFRADFAMDMMRWGGIRRGLDLVSILAGETPEILIDRGLSRIASWSKILSLHGPELYLIYDARVAFSLNYILYDANIKIGYFPMPPNQNTHILRALTLLRDRGVHFKNSADIAIQPFYQNYLNIAMGVGNKLGKPAWQIEMALFARGPKLARCVQ